MPQQEYELTNIPIGNCLRKFSIGTMFGHIFKFILRICHYQNRLNDIFIEGIGAWIYFLARLVVLQSIQCALIVWSIFTNGLAKICTTNHLSGM